MQRLPDDVVADVMDFLQSPVLSCVCRRFGTIWHTINVQVLEDLNGYPLLPTGLLPLAASNVRNLCYTGERFTVHPLLLFMHPRMVTLRINNWCERWNLSKVVMWCRPMVQRLVLRSNACMVQTGTMGLLCDQIADAKALDSLDVRILQGHLNDGSFGYLGYATRKLVQLRRLSIIVPMNSITIAGLQRFMDEVVRHRFLDTVAFDVSGNWIRGPEYGKQLARFSTMQSLRNLQLTFGGWGVRKQFGLEYLLLLGSSKILERLSITIVGAGVFFATENIPQTARITCEFFKKAMQGIAALPCLKYLHLDFRSSDVGEQCHRGLSLLRMSKSLRVLHIGLGIPSERLLSAIGAIQHAPSLCEFRIDVDQRGQAFTRQQAQQLASFGNANCSLHATIQNTHLIDIPVIQSILSGGLSKLREFSVRFSQQHNRIDDVTVCNASCKDSEH